MTATPEERDYPQINALNPDTWPDPEDKNSPYDISQIIEEYRHISNEIALSRDFNDIDESLADSLSEQLANRWEVAGRIQTEEEQARRERLLDRINPEHWPDLNAESITTQELTEHLESVRNSVDSAHELYYIADDRRDELTIMLQERASAIEALQNELDHAQQEAGERDQMIGEQRAQAAPSQERTRTMDETTARKDAEFIKTLNENITRNLDQRQGLLPSQELPFNPASGKRYTASNLLALAAENRPNNMWMTYADVKSLGGNTLKGEHGTNIQIWKQTERGENGETIKLEKPKLSYATVFNVAQTTLTNINAKTPERENAAEFIAAFPIQHDMSPNATPRYDSKTDTITLPPPNRFPKIEDYQRMAVEQIANRQEEKHSIDPVPVPGTPQAAEREMKMKIAAAIIGDNIGIGHTADLDNTIYSNHWKKALMNHPKDILKTMSHAESVAHAAMNEGHERANVQTERRSEEPQKSQERAEYDRESMLNEYYEAHTQHGSGNEERFLHNETVLFGTEATTANRLDDERDILYQHTEMPAFDKDGNSYQVEYDCPVTENRDGSITIGERENMKIMETGRVLTNQEITDLAATLNKTTGRVDLRVPFAEKDAAKEAGCRWDKEQKTWYAPPGTDLNKIAQWPQKLEQRPELSPRDELANTMTGKYGFVLSGAHPIMDGKPHRIEVVGDDPNKHQQSGFYVIHNDGVPAGHICNNRTKEKGNWKAQGYELTNEMKSTLQTVAKEKYQIREEEITKKQEQVATRLAKSVAKMEPITEQTEYMKSKGIGVEPGIYKAVDKSGEVKMAIPLIDTAGKMYSMTTIAEDGTKSYAKDGKKQGCFHVVGGDLASLKDAPSIVVAEGYATAATLKDALKQPVVAAMDSGNLAPVAQNLRKEFPEKAIVICGDDDRKLLDNPKIGRNIGKDMAMEAAIGVGGTAVFPIFPKGTDNQLSDFNDLANKTELGLKGVQQQTQPAIIRAVNNQKEENSRTLIADAAKKREEGRERSKEEVKEVKKELQRDKEKEQAQDREKDRAQQGKKEPEHKPQGRSGLSR